MYAQGKKKKKNSHLYVINCNDSKNFFIQCRIFLNTNRSCKSFNIKMHSLKILNNFIDFFF